MKRNEWQARFGAARRATDKALLQECERSLHGSAALDEDARKLESMGQDAGISNADILAMIEQDERERIARAFGRPL